MKLRTNNNGNMSIDDMHHGAFSELGNAFYNEDYDFSRCRINIVKETAAGYKPYFQNATLDDILSYDDTVMSSTKLCKRCVINGKIIYR